MTSATDELRRLLDERGVEWTYSIGPFPQTNWEVGDVVWHAKELERGFDVTTRYLTPEQAVEATLGRGTCHDAAGKQMAFFSCSACGATVERKHPRFCFACGRKVVDA